MTDFKSYRNFHMSKIFYLTFDNIIFLSSINHENKLKEKLTPIDLKIYEELRDSNMLQDCSMDIDNTSIVIFLF